MSFPGTPQQKAFMDRCTSCHTYERIAKSTYNADDFDQGAAAHGQLRARHHAVRAAEAQGNARR